LPGNHDDRQQMRSSFPEHAYLGAKGFVQYSVPIGDMQLITLDTVVPLASEGSLCEERLNWLLVEIKKKTKFIFKQMIVWNKRFENSSKKGYMDGFIIKNHLLNFNKMAEYILFYNKTFHLIHNHNGLYLDKYYMVYI